MATYTVTEIGNEYNLPPKKVNNILKSNGDQVKNRRGKWEETDQIKGKGYTEVAKTPGKGQYQRKIEYTVWTEKGKEHVESVLESRGYEKVNKEEQITIGYVQEANEGTFDRVFIGKKVKEVRESMEWSQSKLGNAIRASIWGISQTETAGEKISDDSIENIVRKISIALTSNEEDAENLEAHIRHGKPYDYEKLVRENACKMNEKEAREIGRRVKVFRESLKLTQKEFLKQAGIGSTTLCEVENGIGINFEKKVDNIVYGYSYNDETRENLRRYFTEGEELNINDYSRYAKGEPNKEILNNTDEQFIEREFTDAELMQIAKVRWKKSTLEQMEADLAENPKWEEEDTLRNLMDDLEIGINHFERKSVEALAEKVNIDKRSEDIIPTIIDTLRDVKTKILYYCVVEGVMDV